MATISPDIIRNPFIGTNGNWYVWDSSAYNFVDSGVYAEGNGIASIVKSATVGLVDTYTITFDDATTFDYDVTNGSDGATGATGIRGTRTNVGTAITGTETTPTVYATGLSDSIIGDQYAYNGSNEDDIGNIYVCTLGGDAATALWAYDHNQRGGTGLTGDPGANFTILGTYTDLTALRAAVPSPPVGVFYNVGASAPYTVYRSTGEANPNDWESQGTLEGAGVAIGGTTGQFLKKKSGTDYDTEWGAVPAESTSNAGLSPQATAPSAGLRNILGIDNGETAHSDKALFDASDPSTQAFGDAAAVGTAMAAARRDHKHAMPAAGIANTNAVKIDAADVADNDYAKFTDNGLEGRSYAEVSSDIDVDNRIAALTSGGVETGGEVTAQGTPDQTVDVAAVEYITDEGKRFSLVAVDNLAADAADGSNPRIDIVYGSSAGVITYLAGTAAGSPTQPATPAHGVLLSAIARATSDNTIATGDITDQRDIITLTDDFENETSVAESTNTFALDLLKKHTKNFYFTIGNTTGKTVTMSNVPYGTCDVILTIKMTATCAITWTLDGRSVTWAGAQPTWTSGYTYHVLLSYSGILGKWIATALPGAAN